MAGGTGDLGRPQRPTTLSRQSAETLGNIESLFSTALPRKRADAQQGALSRSAGLGGGRVNVD